MTSNTLTCYRCGNQDRWRSVHRDRTGKTTATCGECGTLTQTTGATSMGDVSGGMRMDTL